MSILNIQGQLLEVNVVACSKLKNTEWISRQDPYVCVEYATTKYRTRTCTDGGRNATFQEKFVFTLIEGLREISIAVWNSNTLSLDAFIGNGKVQLLKVLSHGYDDSAWPLQDKKGKYAGEVRLIMHYANKHTTAYPPSGPHSTPYPNPSAPHLPPAPAYPPSVPPSNPYASPSAPHFPSGPAYPPSYPPAASPVTAPHTPHSHPPTGYPPISSQPYTNTPYSVNIAGYSERPPHNPPAPYPPVYPPVSTYPPSSVYPPPPQDPRHTTPGSYPPQAYPPYRY